MRSSRVVRIVKFLPIFVVGMAVLGLVVMSLWNWLLPTLFGFKQVGYWQALGVLVLSRMLFGGFAGGGERGLHRRSRMMERWQQMTPEERERFREGVRGRSVPGDPPAAEPAT